jgi:uncharacterized oxidoreductase
MLLDHEALREAARRIVAAGGSEDEEATIVADHLVEANLKGHDSHGVGMLPHYIRNLNAGTLRPNARGRIASDAGAILVYDGERGYGQVVAREATLAAMAKARQTGIAVLALRDAHHIGRVGAYGEICAEAGLVSLHFVNVIGHQPIVAPHRGRDGRLSTNPVCIAVPAAERGRPIILDMATTNVAFGKVRVAHNKGETLKPGLVIDNQGKPSTDPGVMLREPIGALLPFAEHKGYALAFLCEILAGAVAGGGTLRPENQLAGTITNSMLAFVLDPARIVDAGALAEEVAAITRYVTASPPADPALPVLVPGDPERQMRAARIAKGVPIDATSWAEIVATAASLGVVLAS